MTPYARNRNRGLGQMPVGDGVRSPARTCYAGGGEGAGMPTGRQEMHRGIDLHHFTPPFHKPNQCMVWNIQIRSWLGKGTYVLHPLFFMQYLPHSLYIF